MIEAYDEVTGEHSYHAFWDDGDFDIIDPAMIKEDGILSITPS